MPSAEREQPNDLIFAERLVASEQLLRVINAAVHRSTRRQRQVQRRFALAVNMAIQMQRAAMRRRPISVRIV